MKISLIQIGKTHINFVDDGVDVFVKRLKHYTKFESVVIEVPSKLKTNDEKLTKKYESELLLKKIQPSDYIILLDEKGESLSSRKFASYLEKLFLHQQHIVFIIGGAYGFSEELYSRANHKISLSAMTFSHQLIRLIFAEQLYRAFTIIKGEPYHND
jgi:23S rRNA (pseudouridine1915-N3)-methyltransferase